MGAVKITGRTISLVDELIPAWQEMTKSEDSAALVARSVIDSLLDLRAFAREFDALDVEARTAA